MDLNHEFTVNKPIDEAWVVLTDVEKIAPCLPGAQLKEIAHEDGVDKYRGIVKVKLGAIQTNFTGEAQFLEKDDVNHKAVLKAAGRDTGGRGNANATITATLEPVSDTATTVKVHTDLGITGKVATFGRGVLADVSDKLLAQFADNLNTLIAQDTPTEADAVEPVAAEAVAAETVAADGEAAADESAATDEGTTPPAAPKVRKIDAPEAEPIDLIEHAGAPMLKLLLPALGGLVLLLLLLRRRKG